MLRTPHFFMATIGIPSAWQCLQVAAPFLAFIALRWVIRRVDHTVNRLFPHLEWERRLGWLNITTQRRAEAVLRWIGYVIYALLAAALYGIVWAAPALGQLGQWSDSTVLGEIPLKISVLLICLGCWLVYFGCELLPKLRRQHEEEELEKFRAKQTGLDDERDHQPGSRLKSIWKKPQSSLAQRSKQTFRRRDSFRRN
ncbi:MAG TPA: hypothetical protein VL981_11740 [Candidatus Methylacidiphilales bacterium]|nr:hypothetical protein [Candidatus Methylacidiphilales bacterium]